MPNVTTYAICPTHDNRIVAILCKFDIGEIEKIDITAAYRNLTRNLAVVVMAAAVAQEARLAAACSVCALRTGQSARHRAKRYDAVMVESRRPLLVRIADEGDAFRVEAYDLDAKKVASRFVTKRQVEAMRMSPRLAFRHALSRLDLPS